ncbi:peptidase family M20/M25/M40 [Pseudomassariella vexata]|uniref:Peptidase family M20/M25/M40 n=1 Tax=Pseudomassariella vexata TaxID=1141098 RepID=A0A1Y2DKL7_9PEZI|nr:peptidase family M20/M25/M40 [Pseudomassariella vexata]ORY59704.1 peptidase family M20/M25/M40 [Pseudomassariella vexata]
MAVKVRPSRCSLTRVCGLAEVGCSGADMGKRTRLIRPYNLTGGNNASSGKHALAQCAQVEPLFPTHKTEALSKMDGFLDSVKFRNETIGRMAGAIQVPSQSYDDLGPVGEDKRWDTMYDFAAYLEKTFPLIHSKLGLEHVNTHGLLYTWQGSDESLKPTVLMAHQDVVPVAESTVEQWTYPPFSGHYDGRYVWGRGASDCKNNLIGIMESVELLLDAGFEPKRTLIMSFGFDEESSGREGAGHLAPFLLERYGKNGVAAIVDEGAGVVDAFGSVFATPGVGEKGYIDVEVIVRMPGGHSSIPPPHNGIGVMSEFITTVEANRYEPYFYDENPFLGLLECGAVHAPEFPPTWKKLLQSNKIDKLATEVAKSSDAFKYLFTTSVAVDIIGGGVKVNALPERTTAIINHRVNVGDHPSTVKAKLTKLASSIADKYNLTLHAFTDEEEIPRSITLRTEHDLDSAPVTPTNVDTITPYSILSGTTRGLYGDAMIMAPGIMTGNTDTRYYWDLTTHIFRYVPGWDKDDAVGLGNIHTVDERVSVVGHINNVKWYSAFVRNMDEAELA